MRKRENGIEIGVMFLHLTRISINFKLIVIKKVVILPTKVHLVKAVVFPVVMYGCESWTIKKAEC